MAKVAAAVAVMDIVKRFLSRLDEEGIHVESAYLFGSYAKGAENKWSDIDIAIVSSEITGDGIEDIIRLVKIASKIDTRIEPVPFNPDGFVDEDPLVWEIKKEGMLIEI